MRILAFNYEYPPLGGGGGVVFKDLYDELSKRHPVTIVTTHFGDLARHEVDGNQHIHRVRVLRRTALSTASMISMLTYSPASWLCGRKLLAEGSFDVINSHFVVPTAPSTQNLAGRYKVPHVLSLHGGDLYDPSKKLSPHRLPLLPTLIRRLLRKSDRVIAQSNNTAENARTIYGVDRPIDVIPLGIVPWQLRSTGRESLGIGDDRFVMTTIGRLVARKGLEDLLRVVNELGDERDLLVVIGSGPDREPLEALASELGIRDRVRFTGWISDEEKWDYLGVSDVYASTSLHEGFGLVFLEAMHCGLPVVCYNHGGQTDFLEDGKTGALVSLGQRGDFVLALNRLKESPEFASGCSEFNRDRVRDFYIDRYADRHEALFEEAIRGAHSRARRQEAAE